MYVLFVNQDTQKVERLFSKVEEIRPSVFDTHMLITMKLSNGSPIEHFIPLSSLEETEIQIMNDEFGLRYGDIAERTQQNLPTCQPAPLPASQTG